MHLVIAHELEIVGSHGMAAHAYAPMLALVGSGRLRPDRLITRRIGLPELPEALTAMGTGAGPGVTVALLG
jgi:alcohol dehydrogenase